MKNTKPILKTIGIFIVEIIVILCIIALFEYYFRKLDMVSVVFGFLFMTAMECYNAFRENE